MDSLSPNPHTHDDRKRWQTVVSSLITQWWYDSQISLLITAKRTLTPMNSTWSHLTSSSKSGLSYERGFGVRPQTRITAQFSLTMSISQHSAYREELASEVQSSPGGLPCKFQPQALSLLEVRSANVQKLCVCVCVCVCVRACVRVCSHSVLTLCDPMDCSPPGSFVHGIFQARILEWVAISFSRGSFQPKDRNHVSWVSCQWKWKSLSCVQLFATPWTVSVDFSRTEYWSGWPFLSPGYLPNPGIEHRSPALQAHSLPAEPQGKPKNTGVGSLSHLPQIFMTQKSNRGLLHCRQILYQLR